MNQSGQQLQQDQEKALETKLKFPVQGELLFLSPKHTSVTSKKMNSDNIILG